MKPIDNVADHLMAPNRDDNPQTTKLLLTKGVRSADITVDLSYYLGSPDQRYEVHKITRRVTLDR